MANARHLFVVRNFSAVPRDIDEPVLALRETVGEEEEVELRLFCPGLQQQGVGEPLITRILNFYKGGRWLLEHEAYEKPHKCVGI